MRQVKKININTPEDNQKMSLVNSVLKNETEANY